MYQDSDDEGNNYLTGDSEGEDNESESDGLSEFQQNALAEDDEGEEESDSDEEKHEINFEEILHLWDELLGINFKLDFRTIFLEDPELLMLWNEQAFLHQDNDEEEEEDEESEIDLENIDKPGAESSADTEEEQELYELSDKLSSPSEEENADAFSLDDVNTDREENIGNKTPVEEEYIIEEPFEIGSDYEEKLQQLQQEEKEEEEAHHEEREENEEPVKEKQYRKLPKAFTSDSSEYETIYTESDHADEENEESIKSSEKSEHQEKVETPEPFPWVEYNKEIDHVEPFDGNWLESWIVTKESAPSSLDESDHIQEDSHKEAGQQYDLPAFNLTSKRDTPTELRETNEKRKVVRRKKNRKIHATKQKETHTNKTKSPKHILEETPHKELLDAVFDGKARKYLLNLDVYNYHNYPKYRHYEQLKNNIKGKQNKTKTPKNGSTIANKKTKQVADKVSSFARTRSAREREKFLLKRKKRNLLYERLHPRYRESKTDENNDLPDGEIPSYRVKNLGLKSSEDIIGDFVNLIVDNAADLAYELEKAKQSKEAYFCSRSVIYDICDNVTQTFHEKQKNDAIGYALEVILDSWEEHVYETRLRIIESQLEYVSEEISRACIISCFDEMIEEDIMSTLLVRDILAESLLDEGVRRGKISKRLAKMFHDYNFHLYNFENADRTKTKNRKHYRQKKYFDKILSNRQKKRKLAEKERLNKENKKNEAERREIKRIKDMEDTRLSIIAEKKRLEERQEEERRRDEKQRQQELLQKVDEEKRVEIPPLIVSPEVSDNEKNDDTIQIKKPISKRKLQERTNKMTIRLKTVDVWLKSRSDLIEARKDEYLKNYEDSDEPVEEENEEGDENNIIEQKLDYNSESEGLVEENDGGEKYEMLNNMELPGLNNTVVKALDNNEIPKEITPRLKLIEGRPETPGKERNDSALGSETKSGGRNRTQFEVADEVDEEEEINNEAKNENVEEISEEENKPGESGFESDSSDNDDVISKLSPQLSEEEVGKEKMVELIPKIDRDEYLQIWLQHGYSENSKASNSEVTQNTKRDPIVKERIKRFHKKRPQTPMSEESTFDITQLDDFFYEQAKDRRVRNRPRPTTASTAYTGRESSLTQIFEKTETEYINSGDERPIEKLEEKPNVEPEENPDKGNIEEPDQEAGAKADAETPQTELHPPVLKRPTTIIEFEKYKNAEKQKVIDTSDKAAWEFYERQNDFLKNRNVYKSTGEKTPEKLSPKSKNKIVKSHTNASIKKTSIFLQTHFAPREGERELLQFVTKNYDTENDEELIGSDSPTATSWEYDEDRLLTPNTEDSEAELDELRRKYQEQLIKDRNERWKESENEDQRMWRAFMRKRMLENEIAFEILKKSKSPPKTPDVIKDEKRKKIRKTLEKRQSSIQIKSSESSASSRLKTPSKRGSQSAMKNIEERQKHNKQLFKRLKIIEKNNETNEKRLLPRRASLIPVSNSGKENKRKTQSDGEYSRSASSKSNKTKKQTKEENHLPAIPPRKNNKKPVKYTMP